MKNISSQALRMDSNERGRLAIQLSFYEHRKLLAVEPAFESNDPKQSDLRRQVRFSQALDTGALSRRTSNGFNHSHLSKSVETGLMSVKAEAVGRRR
jgi:hypothetical protein